PWRILEQNTSTSCSTETNAGWSSKTHPPYQSQRYSREIMSENEHTPMSELAERLFATADRLDELVNRAESPAIAGCAHYWPTAISQSRTSQNFANWSQRSDLIVRPRNTSLRLLASPKLL